MAGIAVPLLLVPVVYYGPRYLRQGAILAMIGALLFLAFYNLSSARLDTFVVFTEAVLTSISFTGHPYSRIAAFGFTLVGSLGLLYGLELSKPSEQAAGLVALASVVGIVFSDNFFTLFICWELLTISTASLILLKKSPEAMVAGFYFLAFHLTGGLVALFGILLHFSETGSFDLVEPRAGLIAFAISFGFKAAFIPLHLWLPRGYPSANFPSSVLLAGLTTKIGVYAIARILPPSEAIMLMGASMAIVGVTCALLQHNMRRLLSYHIISQVGFMVAGAGLATHYAVDGALLHLVNHMLYKALLFMSVGAVLHVTLTEDLHDLNHKSPPEEEEQKQPIWKALPLVTAGAVVGALAISGFPLFNGYVSKYILKKAMYGMGPTEIMLLIASIGTAASFCKLIYFGFIKGRANIIYKVPISSQVAIAVTSFFCILLGVYPQLISSLLPYATAVDHVYSLDGIWSSVQLILAGSILFTIMAPALKRGIHLPPAFSIEYLIFAPFGKLLFRLFCQYGTVMDYSIDNFYTKSGENLGQFCRYVTTLDKNIDRAYDKTSEYGRTLAERTRIIDKAIDEGYIKTGEATKKLVDQTPDVDRVINVVYDQAGKKARDQVEKRLAEKKDKPFRGGPSKWNTKNLSFDNLLLVLVLGVVLLVIFYFGRYL